jgi:hypothetical protein
MTTHPLDGTHWRLIAYRSGEDWMETPPDVEVTLHIAPPNAGGKSAVNAYGGRVAFGRAGENGENGEHGENGQDGSDERTFSLTNISCSAMAGSEPLMALEMRYFRLLEGAHTWAVEEERLTLQDAGGAPILQFAPDTTT